MQTEDLVPEDYQGCSNCERQPEPLMSCGLKLGYVAPFCPYWKMKRTFYKIAEENK